MIDPQAVDHAPPTSASTSRWVSSNTVGILLADAGEIVDVKEAAVGAGDGVDVEEALAQLRIGPEAVAVVGGHVVGDHVEHQAQAGAVRGLRQRPQLVLAAELV